MARRLEQYEFGTRRGKPRKYPWDDWTDGKPWEVVQGKDFTCAPGSLVVYLYHKANELGMNVSTSIIRGERNRKDRVVFQFRKPPDVTQPVPKKRRPLKRR